MSYIRWKLVNGCGPYWYEEKGIRECGKHKTKHIRYLGRRGGVRRNGVCGRVGRSKWNCKTVSRLREAPGVYRFYNRSGKLIWVGVSSNIKERVRRYRGAPSYSEGASAYAVRPEVVSNISSFSITYTEDMEAAQEIEKRYLARSKYNRNRSGYTWHKGGD